MNSCSGLAGQGMQCPWCRKNVRGAVRFGGRAAHPHLPAVSGALQEHPVAAAA